MADISGKRYCDVCGKPATHYVKDRREVIPRRDETPFVPVGPWQQRCNDHPVTAMVTTRAGEVITLEEALEARRER